MNLNDSKENQNYSLFYTKLGILFFWFLWFLIAFLTNAIDFLNAYHITNVLHFHSGNYEMLKKVIRIYDTPYFVLNFLFLSDTLIQGIVSVLFFISVFCFWRNIYTWQFINTAFSLSMALWAVFLIMEEVFIAYPYEATHIRLFVFEMVSLLVLHLLPHQSRKT